jgi:MFS family permease
MRLPTFTPGMRTFTLLWLGQLVSMIGSGLTEFALGVDLYNRTGSATQFALFYLCFLVPFLVVSPFAGALVDRWDRKIVLILADMGAALCTALIAVLMVTGYYQTWHLYALVAAGSSFGAFQWPAFTASTSLLVPKEHLGRADGMIELSWGAGRILSPLLAAVLVSVVPLYTLFAIDFVTFLFAVIIAAVVFIPRPEVSEEGEASKGSLWKEIAYGWAYIKIRPGLLGLLCFFFLMNFSLGFVQVLFTPMVLGSHSVQTLGTLISAGSAGVVAGGILMMVWGGPKRRINAVLGLGAVFGLAMMLIGASPIAPMLAAASFLYYFVQPIINGSDEAIWQTKVPPDLQGRVFSLRRSFEWGSSPIAYAISGPIAEHIFDPLLVVGGPLAATAGQVIGVGPGRGIGFLLMVVGLLPLVAAIWGYLHPRIRGVEQELPDVLEDADLADEPAAIEREPLPAGAMA